MKNEEPDIPALEMVYLGGQYWARTSDPYLVEVVL